MKTKRTSFKLNFWTNKLEWFPYPLLSTYIGPICKIKLIISFCQRRNLLILNKKKSFECYTLIIIPFGRLSNCKVRRENVIGPKIILIRFQFDCDEKKVKYKQSINIYVWRTKCVILNKFYFHIFFLHLNLYNNQI